MKFNETQPSQFEKPSRTNQQLFDTGPQREKIHNVEIGTEQNNHSGCLEMKEIVSSVAPDQTWERNKSVKQGVNC